MKIIDHYVYVQRLCIGEAPSHIRSYSVKKKVYY